MWNEMEGFPFRLGRLKNVGKVFFIERLAV